MKEEIIYINTSNRSNILNIEMAGTTFPDSSYTIRRTNSDIYVFEYVLDGCGFIECNNHIHKVNPGDFYLLQKGSTYIYYSDKTTPYTKLWFNASGLLIDSLLDIYNLNDDVIVQNVNVHCIFDEFHNILKTNQTSTAMEKASAIKIHELISIVFYSINPQKITEKNETAKRIKKSLDNSIYDNISLDKLSKKLFISKVQIIRIFKKEYGQTPYAYILNKKIEVAKKLLMNTNMLIKEISNKLCFADEHYFSNIFKKTTGLSPSDYKKINH